MSEYKEDITFDLVSYLKNRHIPDLAVFGEHCTFDDPYYGEMLCVRNYHTNGPWLFYKTPNSWVTLRPASEKDCAALGMPHWFRKDKP